VGAGVLTVGAARGDRRPSAGLAAVLVGTSLVMGLLVGALAAGGRGAVVFAFGLVAVFVLLWHRPHLVPALLLGAVLSIEQFRTTDGPPGGVFTDRIPLFRGLAGGLHVNAADLLLVALVALAVLKTGTGAVRSIPKAAVSYALAGLVAAVALGVFVGRLHGGDLRTAFTEIRPYAYLAAAYALSTAFATGRSALRAVLWAIVLGTGAKALQTVVLFLGVRHEQPRPEAVVGHEEALFFGLFLVLTLALWLYGVRGRLRTTATWLAPVVVAADLVNGRRAAWLIVGACVLVLLVLGLAALPHRRRLLRRACTLVLLVSVVYFPVYWNHTGAIALPARSLHSAISPDVRDSLSDLYREQENANLKLNIRQGGLLGKGFGVPIDYALPITDLTDIDPLIAYVPHDGVLYVLMRMGLAGGIAFWSLLGAGIIGACRLARSRDRELASFGALLACALVGYALEGYNDQGFFFYRIAFAIGALLGIGEAARRFAAGAAVADGPLRPLALASPPAAPARRVVPPGASAASPRTRWDLRTVLSLGAIAALFLGGVVRACDSRTSKGSAAVTPTVATHEPGAPRRTR
jgi:hypothetical protein